MQHQLIQADIERVDKKTTNCVLKQQIMYKTTNYVENTHNLNLKKQKNIRRCVACRKHGLHKETRFFQKQCNQGLCAVSCFEKDYTLKNY